MKTLGLTSWSPSMAFAAVQLGLFFNLLWRNTHITALTEKSLPLCFGIENCTGSGADFQKLFKGRWCWLWGSWDG